MQEQLTKTQENEDVEKEWDNIKSAILNTAENIQEENTYRNRTSGLAVNARKEETAAVKMVKFRRRRL